MFDWITKHFSKRKNPVESQTINIICQQKKIKSCVKHDELNIIDLFDTKLNDDLNDELLELKCYDKKSIYLSQKHLSQLKNLVYGFNIDMISSVDIYNLVDWINNQNMDSLAKVSENILFHIWSRNENFNYKFDIGQIYGTIYLNNITVVDVILILIETNILELDYDCETVLNNCISFLDINYKTCYKPFCYLKPNASKIFHILLKDRMKNYDDFCKLLILPKIEQKIKPYVHHHEDKQAVLMVALHVIHILLYIPCLFMQN